ncbi:Uncharacterised protein [Segatella copri]|nr:Uncharacterised protein [Segatella copri]
MPDTFILKVSFSILPCFSPTGSQCFVISKFISFISILFFVLYIQPYHFYHPAIYVCHSVCRWTSFFKGTTRVIFMGFYEYILTSPLEVIILRTLQPFHFIYPAIIYS